MKKCILIVEDEHICFKEARNNNVHFSAQIVARLQRSDLRKSEGVLVVH